MDKTKLIAIRLKLSFIERIKAQAQKERRSYTEIIKNAVSEYLEKVEK